MIKAREEKLKSGNVHVGPIINCDEVETIITNNNYVCLSCNKKGSRLILISSSGGVVFGSFLGNSCCCISTVSKTTVLMTVAIALVAFAAVTGGILGKLVKVNSSIQTFFHKENNIDHLMTK